MSIRILAFGGCLLLTLNTSAFAQRVRPLEPIAAKLEPTRLEVYKTVGERSLHLHVFEPEGHTSADQRPVFLVIHGGGWTGGTPRWFYTFAERMSRVGMVGISLEYRLMNQQQGTSVFDCVRDACDAVKYIRKNAHKLGIDPERIAVCGASAGGHLAVGTTLFDHLDTVPNPDDVSSTPNALILYYPVIDTSTAGYGKNKIGERWRDLSPVHHVRPGIPPTIIFHGTGDTVTPYSGAVEFAKQMKQAGNLCQLVSHEGGVHGYLIFDLQLYEQALAQTRQFLIDQHILD